MNHDLQIIEGELKKERQMKVTSSTSPSQMRYALSIPTSYTTIHQQVDPWTSKDILNT